MNHTKQFLMTLRVRLLGINKNIMNKQIEPIEPIEPIEEPEEIKEFLAYYNGTDYKRTLPMATLKDELLNE